MNTVKVFSSLSALVSFANSSAHLESILCVDPETSSVYIMDFTAFGLIKTIKPYSPALIEDCIVTKLKSKGSLLVRDSLNDWKEKLNPWIEMGYKIDFDTQQGRDNISVLSNLRTKDENKKNGVFQDYALLYLKNGEQGLKSEDILKIGIEQNSQNEWGLYYSSKEYRRFYKIGFLTRMPTKEEVSTIKSATIHVSGVSHGRDKNGSLYQTLVIDLPIETQSIIQTATSNMTSSSRAKANSRMTA